MSKRLKRPTPEEDAAINAGIAADPDTFEVDNEWLSNAEPAPSEMQALTRKYRGRQKAPTKRAVSMRLSQDVLDAFKANTAKYGPAMDDALREIALQRGWMKKDRKTGRLTVVKPKGSARGAKQESA